MCCLLPRLGRRLRPPKECVSCPSLFERLTGSELHCLWTGSSSQTHSFPGSLCVLQEMAARQNKAPVFRSVCRVNSLCFPHCKKNMLSQLAWVTRIPNRPCMYLGQRSMVVAAGGLIVSAPHLLASITFCRRCNIRVEGLQQHMRL